MDTLVSLNNKFTSELVSLIKFFSQLIAYFTRLVKPWSPNVDPRSLAIFLLLWISAWSTSPMTLTITMMMEMIVTWNVMMVKTLNKVWYKTDYGTIGDDGSGSDDEYSDDDDVSWKVRRAAAKYIEAVSRHEIIEQSCSHHQVPWSHLSTCM